MLGIVWAAAHPIKNSMPGGPGVMTNEAIDRQQQKIGEFLRLLPLTIEIAGLPHSEPGRHYNEGQMETRVNTLRLAYKMARQLVLDVASK
jgi:hypothetical protein